MRPGCLGRVEGVPGVVVVDELQPVAVLLDDQGRFVQQVTWPELTELPPDGMDTRRRLWRADDHVIIQDPGCPAVRIAATGRGRTRRLRCDHVDEPSRPGMPVGTALPGWLATAGAPWDCRNLAEGFRCGLRVARGTQTWSLARASIVDVAMLGGRLLALVRRADKRPWQFDPARELWVYSENGEPAVLDLPALAQPWAPRPVTLSHQAVSAAFAHAQNDSEAAIQHLGATHTRIIVDAAGRAVITHRVTLPDGRQLCRVDEPFNALGVATGGLAGRSIWLDEDIIGGIAEPGAVSGDRI